MFEPEVLARIERNFWKRVDRRGPDECWEWQGFRGPLGYGNWTAYVGGGREGPKYRRRGAHRWAYELAVGAIPDGLVLDHLCRNPPCVNPAHLEPVTQAENSRRAPGWAGNKTHCKNGHPLSGPGANVVNEREVGRKGRAKRRCVTCDRDFMRANWPRYAARRREQRRAG